MNAYTAKANKVVDTVSQYTGSNLLLGYQDITYLARKYEKTIGWNVPVIGGYNSVFELEDGYFAVLAEKTDVGRCVGSTADFAAFCEQNGMDFLYVQIPGKISETLDASVSGSIDFSNQNADAFLQGLAERNVNAVDLREYLVTAGSSYRDLFYRTDHHWKAETGFRATGIIADRLNGDFGFNLDLSLLDIGNYRSETYKDWFLGSQGKKATLARAKPEDISLMYPVFPTDFSLEIPGKGVEKTGDFSIFYDMSRVTAIDYYGTSPYEAYCYAQPPLFIVRNHDMPNGIKVLIVGDSYAATVAPFLAAAVADLVMINPREFTGSIERYAREMKPDVVIVLNSMHDNFAYEDETHTNPFDFR